jgi:peroxiredoxin
MIDGVNRHYNARVTIAGKLRFALQSLRGGRMLNVGDEAPDFTVLDHNGNTVALHDLRGRKVVLWFYPKADTPG